MVKIAVIVTADLTGKLVPTKRNVLGGDRVGWLGC
jgi:hypothetical protein